LFIFKFLFIILVLARAADYVGNLSVFERTINQTIDFARWQCSESSASVLRNAPNTSGNLGRLLTEIFVRFTVFGREIIRP